MQGNIMVNLSIGWIQLERNCRCGRAWSIGQISGSKDVLYYVHRWTVLQIPIKQIWNLKSAWHSNSWHNWWQCERNRKFYWVKQTSKPMFLFFFFLVKKKKKQLVKRKCSLSWLLFLFFFLNWKLFSKLMNKQLQFK